MHSQKISTASQTCDSFLSKEEAEKLREQIKEKEAEIDQLKAQLEKLQLVPRAPTSDESRQYAPSSSHNETSLSGRLLVDEVSLKSQPGMCTILILSYMLMNHPTNYFNGLSGTLMPRIAIN